LMRQLGHASGWCIQCSMFDTTCPQLECTSVANHYHFYRLNSLLLGRCWCLQQSSQAVGVQFVYQWFFASHMEKQIIPQSSGAKFTEPATFERQLANRVG